MSVGAGSLSRPFSRWRGHLSAAGEVLGRWMCTIRSPGVPQPLKGHCSQLHHQLPAAVIPLELIRRSCFSRLVLSSALPAPLCCPCRQGAGTLTGAGETQDRGTLLLLSLQRAVWEGGREDGASGCHPFLGVQIAVEHSDCYKAPSRLYIECMHEI